MNSEEKKLSESDPKEAVIEAIRTAEDFLPQYSDFYFEKKKHISTGKFVFGYLFVILFFNLILQDFDRQIWGVFLWIIIGLILYHKLIKGPILNRKKKCGARFAEYGILKTTFFGVKAPIPYSYIEQAVSSGDIRYKTAGLHIGHGKQKLVFHYEIGDSKAQKHVEECHALLQKHLTAKLPPFEKKSLDLLDRKYFYRKSRRNQTISLLGAMLLFLIYYTAGVLYFDGVIFIALLFGGWECLSLYYLCKGGKLSERNQFYLEKAFADCPHAKMGWRYTGYVYSIVVAVIVICANYFFITML